LILNDPVNTNVVINKKYILLIVIFFVAYCLFLSWSFWFQNVDDAYISFRYGKNLMNGHGLVYNPGENVEGYTNFLWTVATAPFTGIKSIDISIFALSFGLVLSIFNIYLIARITKQFSGLFPLKPVYIILLPVIFFALDDSIAFWAIGGMEFPMYTLFILAAAYYYFKINEGFRNHILMSIFLMLCTLTRPEGNMIFVITMFHFLVYRKQINDWKKKFLRVSAIYALFVILYYGFKYFYYGQVIPNTFYAKGVTDFSMNLLLGFKYLALCMGTRLYIFIFIMFLPFKKVYKDFEQSYLLLFSIVYIFYLLMVGGDWMIANRFFVPIIPFLYILSTIGISFAINKMTSIGSGVEALRSKIVSFGSVVLSFMIFIVTLSLLEYKELIIKDENYKYEHQWSMFGKWLKMNVDPKTVIAVGPAGKIPYYSDLYTIDMWGLNNSFISQSRSKRLQAGHKKFNFDYVLSLNPEFIIGYAGFTDDDVPPRYEKFNAPEEKYQSIDVVFRLKKEFRNTNISQP
jgi:arabinofuranosyltransferase